MCGDYSRYLAEYTGRAHHFKKAEVVWLDRYIDREIDR